MVPGGVLGHSFDSARGVGNDVDGDPRVGGHQRISSVVNLCLFFGCIHTSFLFSCLPPCFVPFLSSMISQGAMGVFKWVHKDFSKSEGQLWC